MRPTSIARGVTSVPKLYGPFQLKEERIDHNVVADSPGVYALGHTRHGKFVIAYLGRADTDLRADLKAHTSGPYHQFKFTYGLSAVDAFEKQCDLFHDLTGLENDTHPRPPAELNDLVCTHCKTALRRESVRTA